MSKKNRINKTKVFANAIARDFEKALDNYDLEDFDSEELKEMREMFVQRAVSGYTFVDVMNISDWFTTKLKDIIEERRNCVYAYPTYFEEEWYEEHKNEIKVEKEKWFGDIDEEKEPELVALRNRSEKECHNRWNEILDKMVFLLGEMNEDTCTKENAYQEQIDELYDKFYEKHFGNLDDIESDEDIDWESIDWDKIDDVASDPELGEEYKAVEEKYNRAEKGIKKYRNACKNEFFVLMSKYFWELGDITGNDMQDYHW